MSDLRRVSPERLPPPGGMLRLQNAVTTRHPQEQFAWRWLATAASLVLLALLLPVWVSRRDNSLDSALRSALAHRSPSDTVEVRNGAALAVPSGHPNVRIYLVQSLPPAEATKEQPSQP
jgi:hypothetical protein